MLLIILVSVAALIVSGLTFFTGFGLGTLLLPFFLLVFPPAIAVAATAAVHLLNNLFKFSLIGRHTAWRVLAQFGLPAAMTAFIGAMLLDVLTSGQSLVEYSILGREAVITPVKLVIGLMVIGFGLFDIFPSLHDLKIDRKWLPVGGGLSGFFGGLSGHQGAMRATFLVKAGLEKEAFIATGIACSILVDITRLSVYGATFFASSFQTVAEGRGISLLVAATLAAFLGAFLGKRLLEKTTIESIRIIIGVLMLLTGLLVAVGLI
jgi:uncharacterized membrane protein YfcA